MIAELWATTWFTLFLLTVGAVVAPRFIVTMIGSRRLWCLVERLALTLVALTVWGLIYWPLAGTWK